MTYAKITRLFTVLLLAAFIMCVNALAQDAPPVSWTKDWPDTDFTSSNIDFNEVVSGGPKFSAGYI